MNWQYTPYTPFLAASVLISLVLAVYMWRQRRAPFAAPIALLMALVALWSFGYILEISAPTLEQKIFWAKIEYIGIAFMPLVWLAIALSYTGSTRWLRGRRLALLAIVPVLTVLSAFTNAQHHLLWRTIELETFDLARGSYHFFSATYGVWFWINLVYSYIFLLIGTIIFVRAVLRSQGLFRGQMVTLVVGALLPWISNILYLTKLNPFPGLDLTPFSFAFTGIALTVGLFRFGLFRIAPVAHDTLFASMAYGVLVLDESYRILDMNPAAGAMLDRQPRGAVGHDLAQIFPDYPELVACCTLGQEIETEISLSQATGTQVESTYMLQISALGKSKQATARGWLGSARVAATKAASPATGSAPLSASTCQVRSSSHESGWRMLRSSRRSSLRSSLAASALRRISWARVARGEVDWGWVKVVSIGD